MGFGGLLNWLSCDKTLDLSFYEFQGKHRQENPHSDNHQYHGRLSCVQPGKDQSSQGKKGAEIVDKKNCLSVG